jgi:hypothetical protein
MTRQAASLLLLLGTSTHWDILHLTQRMNSYSGPCCFSEGTRLIHSLTIPWSTWKKRAVVTPFHKAQRGAQCTQGHTAGLLHPAPG